MGVATIPEVATNSTGFSLSDFNTNPVDPSIFFNLYQDEAFFNLFEDNTFFNLLTEDAFFNLYDQDAFFNLYNLDAFFNLYGVDAFFNLYDQEAFFNLFDEEAFFNLYDQDAFFNLFDTEVFFNLFGSDAFFDLAFFNLFDQEAFFNLFDSEAFFNLFGEDAFFNLLDEDAFFNLFTAEMFFNLAFFNLVFTDMFGENAFFNLFEGEVFFNLVFFNLVFFNLVFFNLFNADVFFNLYGMEAFFSLVFFNLAFFNLSFSNMVFFSLAFFNLFNGQAFFNINYLSLAFFNLAFFNLAFFNLVFFSLFSQEPFFNLPFFNLPFFNLPFFNLPFFNLPFFNLPFFNLLFFNLPFFNLPFFNLPFFNLPFFNLVFFSLVFFNLFENAPFFNLPFFNLKQKRNGRGNGLGKILRRANWGRLLRLLRYIDFGGLDHEIPWNIARVSGNQYNGDEYSGSSVQVAVLDTGIDPNHPDLSDNVVWMYDATGNGFEDHNGHGTHISGIVGAVKNGFGVAGVMADAEIYSIKVIDSTTGEGEWPWLEEAIYTAVAGPDGVVGNEDDADVINMSFGSGTEVPPQYVHKAMIWAYEQGVTLVAAGGNAGDGDPSTDEINYPAAYDEVIGVGASTYSDGVADFSSSGDYIELIAPGDLILSTFLDNSYVYWGGTSMATPHVSGLVALIIAQYGHLPIGTIHDTGQDTIRGILHSNARDLGPSGWDPAYGYGIANFS